MDLNNIELDRRGVLRAGAIVGGTAASAVLLSSCTNSSEKPADDESVGAPKKGGTLRVGIGAASSADTVDTHRTVSNWDIGIGYQLYNCLLDEHGIDGDPMKGTQPAPAIAASAEYDGPQKLIVKLRPDVEFHHGKTLDAEDVLFSIRRVADPKDPKGGAAMLDSVDLKNSRAIDKSTVEIMMTRPDSFLRSKLTSSFLRIYPVDWTPQNAAGTGPWKLKEFKPGKFISFEPFANHWDGAPYADEMVWEAYNDPSALANALTSGAVDLIANVPVSQINLLKANSRFKVLQTPTGSPFAMFAMAMQREPFTDVRVREAFRLMVDRQAFVDQCFSGHATIANDLFNPYDVSYNSDLPQREHDPEEAKSLLAAAGASDLTLDLAVAGYVPNIETVFAQTARAAGVTINVKKVDLSTFYSSHWMQDPLFFTSWTARPIEHMIPTMLLPNSPYLETQENNPKVESIWRAAEATLDRDKQVILLKDLQKELWEKGGFINPAYPDQVDAVSARVQGTTTDPSGRSFGSWNLKPVWLA